MDTLSKLIASAFLFLACWLCASEAHADVPYDVWYASGYNGQCSAVLTYQGATPTAVANQSMADSNACGTHGETYVLQGCTTPSLSGPVSSAISTCSYGGSFTGSFPVGITCSVGKNLTPDSPLACVPVQCPAGQVWNGTQCAPDSCAAKKGQGAVIFIANSDYNPGSLYANGTCNNGCIVTPGNLDPGWKLGNVVGWKGAGIYSGASCTAQPGGSGGAAPSSSPSGGDSGPTSCPAGQTWGQVNGVNVCSPAPNGQGSNYSQNSTTQNTSTPNPGGGDPSSSSTTTTTGKDTKCEAGICTTTTTTTNVTTNNPGGSGGTPTTNPPVTTTSTQQQPQADFCKENPQVALCKNSSITGGGACATPIATCEGDAIACNIARNTWAMTCAFQQTNATSTLGQGVIDGAMPSNDPRDNVKDVVLPSALTVTNPYNAACPADKVISLPQSKTLTIPLSRLCPYLQIMGNILVAISLIVALTIVFKRS